MGKRKSWIYDNEHEKEIADSEEIANWLINRKHKDYIRTTIFWQPSTRSVKEAEGTKSRNRPQILAERVCRWMFANYMDIIHERKISVEDYTDHNQVREKRLTFTQYKNLVLKQKESTEALKIFFHLRTEPKGTTIEEWSHEKNADFDVMMNTLKTYKL